MHQNVLQCIQINPEVWLLLWHLKHADTATELVIRCQDSADESMDNCDDGDQITTSWQHFNCLQRYHIILSTDQKVIYISQYRKFSNVLHASSRAIWAKVKDPNTATNNIRNLENETILINNNVKRSQQINSNLVDQETLWTEWQKVNWATPVNNWHLNHLWFARERGERYTHVSIVIIN
jgi:hypothetical protein